MKAKRRREQRELRIMQQFATWLQTRPDPDAPPMIGYYAKTEDGFEQLVGETVASQERREAVFLSDDSRGVIRAGVQVVSTAPETVEAYVAIVFDDEVLSGTEGG